MKQTRSKNGVVWHELNEPLILQRNERSQLQATLIRMNEEKQIHVSIREFEKFTLPEEREVGLKVEQMPYRRTRNGITIKAEKLGELIKHLQTLQKQIKG